MKQLPLNKKLKTLFAEHFARGGTIHNVKGDLERVSMPDRQSCWEFYQRKKERDRSVADEEAFNPK